MKLSKGQWFAIGLILFMAVCCITPTPAHGLEGPEASDTTTVPPTTVPTTTSTTVAQTTSTVPETTSTVATSTTTFRSYAPAYSAQRQLPVVQVGTAASEELPRTGAWTDATVAFAMACLLIGAGLVVIKKHPESRYH